VADAVRSRMRWGQSPTIRRCKRCSSSDPPIAARRHANHADANYRDKQ
jgi:hypothetical protein